MSEELEFTPRPHNNFDEHIREYFERSKEACPKIEAIYGKWNYEDLIPGMSDFDTRFLVSSDVTPEDWVEMSREVGRIHTEICREHPDRARILEHLPGLNFTWKEVADPMFYYPEFHQWSFFYGDSTKAKAFRQDLHSRPWSQADELFSIKKFALYFTPYDRKIDPPINLGPFENKYPLHSRFMHYFCPPVQCAVSIRSKKMIKGKFESLRLAREIFPNPEVIDMIFDSIEKHYETPELYAEPYLSEVEDKLFNYLNEIYRIIQPQITVIDAPLPSENLRELLFGKLKEVSSGVMARFFEGIKFCRMMMGRLLFYSEEIPHFDSSWLIRHELGRIRRLFFETTFSAFAIIAWDEELTPEDALERSRSEFLSEDDYQAVKNFADIFSESYNENEIKNFSKKVAARMAPFQVAIERLAIKARELADSKKFFL